MSDNKSADASLKEMRSLFFKGLRSAPQEAKEALEPLAEQAKALGDKMPVSAQKRLYGTLVSVKGDGSMTLFKPASQASRATGKPGHACQAWANGQGAKLTGTAPVTSTPSAPTPQETPATPAPATTQAAAPVSADPLAAIRHASAAALAPLAAQAGALAQQAAALGATDPANAYQVARQAEAQVAALKAALRNLKAL